MKIKLEGIYKKFKSEVLFENVNITFDESKIIGVIGPNGCGKTVLLKIICGLVYADMGSVYLDEDKLKKGNIIEDVGAVLDKPSFYSDLTAIENLEMLASINKKISHEDIERTLLDVGLQHVENKKVKLFSLGMKQRLSIAQAIMENQKILLLDEFTNALDDEGCTLVKEIIRKEAKKGKIIVLTSHIKDDLYDICDKIYTIKNKNLELIVYEK